MNSRRAGAQQHRGNSGGHFKTRKLTPLQKIARKLERARLQASREIMLTLEEAQWLESTPAKGVSK